MARGRRPTYVQICRLHGTQLETENGLRRCLDNSRESFKSGCPFNPNLDFGAGCMAKRQPNGLLTSVVAYKAAVVCIREYLVGEGR